MSCAALCKDEIFILTRKLNSDFPDSECLLMFIFGGLL